MNIASLPALSFSLSVLAAALGLAVAPGLARAAPQETVSTPVAPIPDSPAACAAIEVDADRLSCYDAVMNHQSGGPDTADQVAENARETKQVIKQYQRLERKALPPGERARATVNDLFRSEDGTNALDARIANAGKGGLLDSRWELAKDSKLGVFNFRAYKPVYLLPAFWTSDVNDLPNSSNPDNTVTDPQNLSSTEAKFQLSFKTKAVENLFGDNGDVWLGYTQSSRWQVYNSEESRPFRESNYEPEAMLVFRTNYNLGFMQGRMLGIGVNHQSNGREDPLSRSWNRVIASVGLDNENWAVTVRPWWRISDGNDDDNPDIEDYMGRGDLTVVHTRDGHQVSMMLRHSLRSGEDSHGAVQLDWGFPINNTLRGHVQVFDGYGESLIDYNHRATYVGFGISLLEWF